MPILFLYNSSKKKKKTRLLFIKEEMIKLWSQKMHTKSFFFWIAGSIIMDW